MNRRQISNAKNHRSATIRQTTFALAVMLITLNNQAAYANSLKPNAYRVSVAGDKFSDTWQLAAAFNLRPPRRLRARYLELVVGTTSTSNEIRPFVSLGPVWRLPTGKSRLFLDLGFSPTFFGGSTFNDRDLGGNLHFTSSAAIGMTLGARDSSSISLRIQHTSNGGLSSTNPGMDMIGIDFAFNPER